MTDIQSLDIPERLCSILKCNNVNEVEDLIGLCGRELLRFRGIGRKALKTIEVALHEAGFELSHDEYAPYLCARHGQERGDTSLASLYLCDDCAHDFQHDAFRGKDPEYMSSATFSLASL